VRDIIELLREPKPLSYMVATVSSVSTATGRVTLAIGTQSFPAVPYLLSYTPTVGDKVQVLSSDTVGMLVLGETLATAVPATPTVRTAIVPANRSMTWAQDTNSGANGQATDGLVRQGTDVLQRYSGAYVYPAATITLAATEIITQAEMLLNRVDPAPAGTASPVLYELTGFSDAGEPIVELPNSFLPQDLNTADALWVPIPVIWALHVVQGTSQGLAFVASSAQQALVYSEYAAYDTVVLTGNTAGSLRLTIENSP